MDEPTRMYTDPNSGAKKELKLCRLSLIDPTALHALGSVAGYGATKYGDNNWTGGYPWSHSVDALYRHLLSWQQGNNLDYESGLPHLAHAAWHCLALLAYQQHDAGVDTRNPWNTHKGDK